LRGCLHALVISAMLASSSAYAQSTPNVVLMLGDNVGYGDVGAYGAGEVRGMPTPNIDQLARARLHPIARRLATWPIFATCRSRQHHHWRHAQHFAGQ
jgi:hypothetical protein